jgi:hypothetical protein
MGHARRGVAVIAHVVERVRWRNAALLELKTAPVPIDLRGSDDVHQLPMRLPFVPGMTDVAVKSARLTVEAIARVVSRSVDPLVLRDPAPQNGVIVDLHEESRLIGFELGVALAASETLEIRAATASSDSGLAVFSWKNETRKSFTFPALTGTAWLIQITGRNTFTIASVLVEELPRDLTLNLRDGGETLELFRVDGVLLPSQGEQEVIVRSEAERFLQARLASRVLGLSLPLEIASSRPSQIAIRCWPVSATFVLRPHEEPLRVKVRGTWASLPIDLPAGPIPQSASCRITARHRGRVPNVARGLMPRTAALHVDATRSAAALLPLHPPPGGTDGGLLAIGGVRLELISNGGAEIAVELRADAGGAPGPLVAAAFVLGIAEGWNQWLELEPPAPPVITTGPSALWVVLRATRGAVLWCCDSRDEPVRGVVSTDGGATWAPPDTFLDGLLVPRVELDHGVVVPSEISVDLRVGAVGGGTWTLQQSAPGSSEFSGRVVFTQPALTAFSQRPDVAIRSAAALDVTVDEIELVYEREA